jgi:hypothetical protein
MDKETGIITFYGLEFDTICTAIPFLRMVQPGETYNIWYFRGSKGIQDKNDMIYVHGKWFTNDDEAEYYINKQYGKLRRSKIFEEDRGEGLCPTQVFPGSYDKE